MATTTIQLTKKNNVISEVRQPFLVTEFANGERESKPYNKNVMPGIIQGRVIKFDPDLGKYPITLSQEELNKAVKEMHLYDDEGEITTADVKNERDRFFTHEKLKIYFESGFAQIDPESPKGKIWRNYVENHPDYKTKKKRGDLKSQSDAKASFTYVDNDTLDKAEEAELLSEEDRANELLYGLDTEKGAKVARAMGVRVPKEANIEAIRNALRKKAIWGKDKTTGGKRNIQYFIQLAEMPDKKLNLKSIIEDARRSRIITKRGRGGTTTYSFGDIKLGNSRSKVEEFLSDKDNQDVLDDIMTALDNRD